MSWRLRFRLLPTLECQGPGPPRRRQSPFVQMPDNLNLSSEVLAVVRPSLMHEGSRTILRERLGVPGCFWVPCIPIRAYHVDLTDLYTQRTTRRTTGLMARRQKMSSRTLIVCIPPRRRSNSGSLFWVARTIL